MPLVKYIILYFLTLPVFLGIDMIWLGVIAKNLYKNKIGHLMSDTVNWPAALIFYLLFIVGIIIFGVNPALEKESLIRAALLGGLFGFLTYATYDLTNYATLKNWPLEVVIIDIMWGVVLGCLTSGISYYIAKLIA